MSAPMKLSDWLLKDGRKQREIAALFGISEGYLSQLVQGNRLGSLPVAVRIERATKGAVTASDLMKAYEDQL